MSLTDEDLSSMFSAAGVNTAGIIKYEGVKISNISLYYGTILVLLNSYISGYKHASHQNATKINKII